MVALLTLLSSKKSSKGDTKPAWLNPAVSSLLSQQVARPGGVLGILNVMLGRAEQGRFFDALAQRHQTDNLPTCRSSVRSIRTDCKTHHYSVEGHGAEGKLRSFQQRPLPDTYQDTSIGPHSAYPAADPGNLTTTYLRSCSSARFRSSTLLLLV